ncbi:ADP-ribose glycohydrolase MACROD2 [Erinaceus europaeus]|uniref:ADP-ribose glycohydrolase MACROD2 n=1 Tax=Erinaceus europaeus TaxID=9365 RepID=A0ABM3Y9B7_ERIEU|nr:ADP-ribose glycohydrolase MACROD2 [Erinaceus europaeus]
MTATLYPIVGNINENQELASIGFSITDAVAELSLENGFLRNYSIRLYTQLNNILLKRAPHVTAPPEEAGNRIVCEISGQSGKSTHPEDSDCIIMSVLCKVDRIIFCVFLEVDFKIYKKKMTEFFPIDDNNEDVDMKEIPEGLQQKDLSSPCKISKAKKAECSKDSSDDENGPEEKQSAEEMEGQSQEADGVNTTTTSSPASEKAVKVCEDEDSSKDDNITKDNEVTDYSVCDQNQPYGQEDLAKNEIKTEAESQSLDMETEELSSNQEDATIVEQPEVIPLIDDQEEKDAEKAQGEDITRIPVKSGGSGDTENSTSPDIEMNSQGESLNDPTETQQED